uniref:Uncharacterized protein n=1 Tax=Spumella elongata TaxID=89044 RepID=A0A7S3GXW7_9STRA
MEVIDEPREFKKQKVPKVYENRRERKGVSVKLGQSFRSLLDVNRTEMFLHKCLPPTSRELRLDPLDTCSALEHFILEIVDEFKQEVGDFLKFESLVVGKSGADVPNLSEVSQSDFHAFGPCKSLYGRWKEYRRAGTANTKVIPMPVKCGNTTEKKHNKAVQRTLSQNEKTARSRAEYGPPPVCMVAVAAFDDDCMPQEYRQMSFKCETYGEHVESVLQTLFRNRQMHHHTAGLGGAGMRCKSKFFVIYICIYANFNSCSVTNFLEKNEEAGDDDDDDHDDFGDEEEGGVDLFEIGEDNSNDDRCDCDDAEEEGQKAEEDGQIVNDDRDGGGKIRDEQNISKKDDTRRSLETPHPATNSFNMRFTGNYVILG